MIGTLTRAEAAREVLRAEHRGRLVTSAGPAAVRFLDDDGQPVVVVPPADAAWADGAATLTVTGAAGVVVLRGRLRRVLGHESAVRRALDAVLLDHVGCLLDLLGPGPVALSRLELSEVAYGGTGTPLHAVDLTEFATAGTVAASLP